MVIWTDNVSSHDTEYIKNHFNSIVDNIYCRDKREVSVNTRVRTPNRQFVNYEMVQVSDGGHLISTDNHISLLPDIISISLPPYTTCYLQPCDVLLNKLIKDIARRGRNEKLYQQFQVYRKERIAKLKNQGSDDSKFILRTENYKDSLFEVLEFYNENLIRAVDNVKTYDCFVRCGLFPQSVSSDGKMEFNQFVLSEHQKTVFLKVPPVYVIEGDSNFEDESQSNREVDLSDYIDDAIDIALSVDVDEENLTDDDDEEDGEDENEDVNDETLHAQEDYISDEDD